MPNTYIFGPVNISSYWHHGFYIFANSISNILKENNINNTIIDKIPDNLDKNDVILMFQPYFKFFKEEINAKIIFINSEAINIRSRIIDEISKNNIKMIWEYTLKNIEILKTKTNKEIHFIPPLYNIFAEQHFNKQNCEKDIDFLFYGGMNNRREFIINKLKEKYNVVVHKSTRYQNLYNLLYRTKIVIILFYYPNNSPIDFYRLSFPISNKIFVIHEDIQEEEKENKIKFNKIIFSKYDEFIDTCEKYINLSQSERDEIANETYKWFKMNHSLEKYIPIQSITNLLNNDESIKIENNNIHDTKIYIYCPPTVERYWQYYFYLFANSLSNILTKNNINNEITNKIPQNINSSTIIITSNIYYRHFSKSNAKIIYINEQFINNDQKIIGTLMRKNIIMVWDFCQKNIDQINKEKYICPLLYNQFLEDHYIKNNHKKTTDFLIFGSYSERRKEIILKLKEKYTAELYITNNFQRLHDKLNKTKIVIIIMKNVQDQSIDFSRISLLLSNKIFFIHEDINDNDYNKIIYSKYENIIECCEKYIKINQEERDIISSENYEWFKKNFNQENYVPIQKIKSIL